MAENKEGVNGLIAKLALVVDTLGDIFPKSKAVVVFSLIDDDFDKAKLQVNDFSSTEQFKIDISGTEFIFLKEKLLNKSEDI
jgi:hypothetical protein